MLEVVPHILAQLGFSSVVAVATGVSMGLYLAAINKFIPVKRLSKSLMTNVVIGISFFVPILLQRYFISDVAYDSVTLMRWAGATILWLIFSTTADIVNYLVSRYVTERRIKELQDSEEV